LQTKDSIVIHKPKTERMTLFLTVFLGITLSLRNGIKGWANIYLGNEEYWSRVLWFIFIPIILVGIFVIVLYVNRNSDESRFANNPIPKYAVIIWTVLLIQNFIAQIITGPWSNWIEFSFSLYYLFLFLISVAIVYHYHFLKLLGITNFTASQ